MFLSRSAISSFRFILAAPDGNIVLLAAVLLLTDDEPAALDDVEAEAPLGFDGGSFIGFVRVSATDDSFCHKTDSD